MSFRLWFSKLIHCLEKGWDSFVLVASLCRFSIWPFVVSAAQSWRRPGNLLEAGSSLVRWMLGESDSRKLVADEYQPSPTNQPTRRRSGCQQRWRLLQKSRKLWNLSARPHLQASMEFAGKRGLVNLLLKFLVIIQPYNVTSRCFHVLQILRGARDQARRVPGADRSARRGARGTCREQAAQGGVLPC